MTRPFWGWVSDFKTLYSTGPRVIRDSLHAFLSEASSQQILAWDESIPAIQIGTKGIATARTDAEAYTAILEYELPMESRRPDVILLENGSVLVLEVKSKEKVTQADLDQVSAYVRDLRCYHKECDGRLVHPILVLMRAESRREVVGGVFVVGPLAIEGLISDLSLEAAPELLPEAFLNRESYSPLPTLVKAARELFESKTVRSVWRAKAITDPTVDCIASITHEAAKTKTRRLVLLTGVPGSGKTLVGLRLVHAGFLDDLAISRKTGKPTAPAIFLSGNGPLVEVLQYELRKAGGSGKTFVRGVKDYVEAYTRRKEAIPPEHLLVFDEAQRAWDAAFVAEKHKDGLADGKSEPEHFIEFAGRIPDWCVVVGLIGEGQEINKGEEGGIEQWKKAIEGSPIAEQWKIHVPPKLGNLFSGKGVTSSTHPELNLEVEIRFHLTPKIHEFVGGLLEGREAAAIKAIEEELFRDGHRLLVTRSLEVAKNYARERYRENPDARFGLVASARDKFLSTVGVDNTFQGTKNLRIGPWYSEGDEGENSCRNLLKPITEFQAQGLEIDLAILCWGTDFIWGDSGWDTSRAARYKAGTLVKDPARLRLNAYRVLLTRGRDGTVVYVPAVTLLDRTFERLVAAGFRPIS